MTLTNALTRPKSTLPRHPPPPVRAGASKGSTYGEAALEQECAEVAATPEGERNNRLNAAAFALGQLVAGGELGESDAERQLFDAARHAGLGESEIRATIASGFEAGKQEPRSARPRESQRVRSNGHGEPPDEPWEPTDEDAPDAPPSSEQASGPTAWPVLDVAGIFAPLEPIQYLIGPLDLCPGAPALIAGYGFSGKTVAAQSMAVSVAAGLPVWGTFTARRGRVLHVDYEQGARLTRERYQRLATGMMVTPDDLAGQLELVSMPSVYLDTAGMEGVLAERCAGFDLLLVDSLRAACPTIEENDSGVRIVLDMLTRVSERTGACIIVIHHARKPSQDRNGGAKMAIRGSGAIFDACSSVLVFEADKGEPTRVSHEKARTSGKLVEDFVLRITDVDADGEARGGLIVAAEGAPSREQAAEDAAQAKREARVTKVLADVRDLFAREPDQGGTDAIALKVHRNASEVRRALRVMVAEGEITVGGSTTDRRHSRAGRE